MLFYHLIGLVAALDCSKLGMEFLDKTLEITNVSSTPPVMTKLKAYINPCSPVQGHKLCEKDDHFCLVESIDDKVTAVKPIGSFNKGSKEMVSIQGSSENGDEDDMDPEFPFPIHRYTPPDVSIYYAAAQWGDSSVDGMVEMYCSDEPSEPVLYSGQYTPVVTLMGPEYCFLNSPDKGDKGNKGQDGAKKGWGFFKWMFVLAILAGLAFVVKTVYINYAQSRGSLPLGVDLSDIVKDLPYLIRDAVRKISGMFTNRSTSGYSAL